MSVVIRGEQGGMYGGMGAELEGEIAVTAGETLYACVAEGGGLGGAGDLLERTAEAAATRCWAATTHLGSPFGIAGGGGGYGGGPGGNGGDASMIWESSAPMGLSQGSAGAGLGADGNGGGLGGMNSENESADGFAGGDPRRRRRRRRHQRRRWRRRWRLRRRWWRWLLRGGQRRRRRRRHQLLRHPRLHLPALRRGRPRPTQLGRSDGARP